VAARLAVCDDTILHSLLFFVQNALSNDRVEMESKMQELMTGIRTINAQCGGSPQLKKQRSFPTPADIYSSLRRARSSATAATRPSNLKIVKDKTSAENLSEDLDTPNLSQDSILSSSSQTSLSNINQPMVRQRSSSAAASLKHRPSKPSPVYIPSAVSCGNIEEKPWLPATPIHELPESPTLLSSSSPSLQFYSIHGTIPRNACKRSCSVSSPPENKVSPTMLISTPNISYTQETENYHTLPNKHSHSESVINSSIPEDEVDYASVTDSLSQVSTCTDEGSPKNGGTIIARRSSLTGQIEHYRKPQLLTRKSSQTKELSTKRNSLKELLTKKNSYPVELLAAKTGKEDTLTKRISKPSASPSESTGFKVLNRGRKSRRYSSHRISAILPGIETTV
jgi:hypothetical protein